MFYGMINIAAVNASVIYVHSVRKDRHEKKINRKDFLFRIAPDLVTPFVTKRYKLSSLPRNTKTAIVMCGFVSNCEENICRTLKTTRLYRESKGAVMYAAEVEM